MGQSVGDESLGLVVASVVADVDVVADNEWIVVVVVVVVTIWHLHDDAVDHRRRDVR